jgi:hypothetical protein
LDRIVDGFNPDECNWSGDIFGRDIEGNESNGKAEPDEEGDQPSEVVTMKNKSSNPPAVENISPISVRREAGSN